MSNQKKTTAQVNLFKNGPIKLSGNYLITAANGEAINLPPGQDVYLCACGRSSDKPFCDGSHKR